MSEEELQDPPVEEEIDAPEKQEEPSQELDIETRAKLQGHTSKEEWEAAGCNPEDWVDAAQFIEDGENNNKLLRARLSKMESKLTRMEKFQEQNNEIAREEAQRRADERLQKAIEDMDESGIKEAVEARDNVRKLEPVPKEDHTDVIADFRSRNDWYETDPALTAMAQSLSGVVMRDMPHLSPTENLLEVEKRMQPYMKSKPKPKSPGVASGRKKAPIVKTGFASLDEEHQANFRDIRHSAYKHIEDDKKAQEAYYASVTKRSERIAARRR